MNIVDRDPNYMMEWKSNKLSNHLSLYFTRRVSGFEIIDSIQILEYVLGKFFIQFLEIENKTWKIDYLFAFVLLE